jgi:hypothetical protein
MHAVVVNVTINDREGAQQALTSDVVPNASQAPGFVAGYWVALGNNKGTSTVVFESEDTARAAAERIQQGREFVTFDSVQVGEVVGSA